MIINALLLVSIGLIETRGEYAFVRMIRQSRVCPDIFVARHETHGEVAVKCAKGASEAINAEFLAMKVAEGIPGAIRPIERFLDEQGNSCIAMELVGDDMWTRRQTLPRGMPLATAVSIGISLIDFITVLHRRGLVHGDISSSNMATRLGGEGNELVILDFETMQFSIDWSHRHVELMRATAAIAQLAGVPAWPRFVRERDCTNIPVTMCEAIVHVQDAGTEFDAADYALIRSLLVRTLSDLGIEYAGRIIWT